MTTYAKNTTVSREKSVAEIESTLMRYGATSFAYGWEGSAATVMFQARGRRIRFDVPMPDRRDKTFTHAKPRASWRAPVPRTDAAAHALWEGACRQRWRSLLLVIKAKLEAVAAGICVFEEEFMAHTILPNGQRVGTMLLPQIAAAYETGCMPPMLAGPQP